LPPCEDFGPASGAGIIKAGNVSARRALIKGARTYPVPARASGKLHAWRGRLPLCARYRRLAAAGKPNVLVTTAIVREMVGFVWAIARIAHPALA